MTHPAPVMNELLSRVDSILEARPDLSPWKVSKRLFGSGHALDDFRTGSRDPRLKTVTKAFMELDKIEKERRGDPRKRGRA